MADAPLPALTQDEYAFFSGLIHQQTGIYLGAARTEMVYSRLLKRVRALGLKSFADYASRVKRSSGEMKEFINALTTNKTNFFREPNHFEYLENVYCQGLLAKKKKHTICVWSAACSEGHEVYSLALLLNAFCSLHPQFDYRILGTDIDTDALATAKAGVYPGAIMDDIPYRYSAGQMLRRKTPRGDEYTVTPELRNRVKFRKYNLAEGSPLAMKFDLIFVRNVMIYFDQDLIQKIVTRMQRQLQSEGLLFIGSSESLLGIQSTFHSVDAAVYQKGEAA